MADEPVSFTSLVLVVVIGGLVIRYLFFSPSTPSGPSGAQRGPRDAAAITRAREAAVERVQQMFPQLDRRTILWELQRNRGNIAATTERILGGRMETPPITFQPPPPPTTEVPASTPQAAPVPTHPAEPDLITRYKLQEKLSNSPNSEPETSSAAVATGSEKKQKSWSSNPSERQAALQRRRDEMILAARRKMEARIAAEKAAASGGGVGGS
ncbi:hypothetical protein GGS20DRAFT_271520 [Poronia punctata]|nr:hypothetical protein GGS20DRAFT_271520 [Poronia punctata]